MMRQIQSTVIDSDLCTGCGLCVPVCPTQAIEMRGGKAEVTGEQSLICGHCEAACPTGAIRVTAIDDALAFGSFKPDDRWLPHGEFDTAQLIRLMRSRRSCRNYIDKPVDRILLEDLVKAGITAPSATNSQMWTFTVLPTRKVVLALGECIAEFFRSIIRLSEKSYLRTILKLLGKPELDNFHRNNYESVKEALEEREKTGRDRLFHGATALIIVGSKPEASCPKEDAMLASQNILLTSHSMGLGSCLIGYAVAAINKDRKTKKFAGIPDDETAYAVIALGYPSEKYQRPAGRKKVPLRFIEI